ncbi:hypothetical protein [Novipirellula sp.]|uniref:hypothetical protein n=1 Tax=Novipirellula sp. TaxID=2795430 RepID=UPI0035666319
MSPKIVILPMAAAIVMLLALTWAAPSLQSATEEPRRSWEHLAMTVDAADGPGDAETSRKIVQLGGEGWELVDVESLVKDGASVKLIYFFKRPK